MADTFQPSNAEPGRISGKRKNDFSEYGSRKRRDKNRAGRGRIEPIRRGFVSNGNKRETGSEGIYQKPAEPVCVFLQAIKRMKFFNMPFF